MNNHRYSVEFHVRTYDDEHGDFVEVRDDQDGLGLAEIRFVERDGREHSRFVMPIPMLERFIDALDSYKEYRIMNPLG